MDDKKIKESLLIAEELVKELCTGKPSTSLLTKQWKERHPEQAQRIKAQDGLSEEIDFHDSIDTEKALAHVSRRIVFARKNLRYLFIGIAASLLLVTGFSALWMQTDETRKGDEWISVAPEAPLTTIATPDGTQVELGEKRLEIKNERLIAHSTDGVREMSLRLANNEGFNKLSVPAGGNYQLTLEDGTEVQMNTDSELLFPTRFRKNARRVVLTGEAYFRVKADKACPFYVEADKLTVMATGTAFCIKSYPDDEEIQVTLIEGTVSVREGRRMLAELTPGQKFTYRKDSGEGSVEQASLSAETDWTEGKFIFRNATVEDIMHELSRWYGVRISTDSDVRQMRYSGILSRKQPLIEILDALRMTNELDFKVYRDKRISTGKKKNK